MSTIRHALTGGLPYGRKGLAANSLFNRMRVAVRRWRRVRRAAAELKRLDDRMLADIGLCRSVIRTGLRDSRDIWDFHR